MKIRKFLVTFLLCVLCIGADLKKNGSNYKLFPGNYPHDDYQIFTDSLERDLVSDASQNTTDESGPKNGKIIKNHKDKKKTDQENKHNLPSSTIKLTKEEKERLETDVMLMNLEAVGLQDLKF